ncbi:MAG: DNA polymerase III subunit beta [Parcubacteria group bacterium]|nr:DNA polymerase III subunit beta [Parcubacteria group bacterium]
MKLIILKNNIKEGMGAVEGTAQESSGLPILKNILIKAENNELKLTATNLEMAISYKLTGKIIKDGGLTVPAVTLSALVNNINNERISLEKSDNTLLFKTDNYNAVIQGINESEFPIIPKVENENEFIKIDAAVFKNALNKVIDAAQFSDIRPEISGVLLDFQLNFLKLAATDSFRLAEKTIPNSQFSTTNKAGFKAIIPLKTSYKLLKLLKDDGTLFIYSDQNQIVFKSDGLEIISRLIDGSFPDYESIIPSSVSAEIIIDKKQFIEALKLSGAFSGKSQEVKLKSKSDKKVLEVFSADHSVGENSYLIPAKIKGDEFEVAFNRRFLLDGLKNHDSENVVFGINGDFKPSTIKTPNDNSFFYILMPIKS